MNELHELRDMLCKELKSYSNKGISNSTLDTVDKLAHALKNLDKVIETDEGYSCDYGRSYARRRDSMGRYSGRYPMDYSRHGGMVEELRELMNEAQDERTRSEFQRFISKLEAM